MHFLKRKCGWITAQLKDLKRLQKIEERKEYISGESFLYLGRQYKLIVKNGKKTLSTLRMERLSWRQGRMLMIQKKMKSS
ncbi:DUF45 domain-containing protein [Candidatus Peregrinibacteria bacterium]|nr:MAG: DUF45 domain-containing protein [Candidatus Peregrinibacteria bacterium]